MGLVWVDPQSDTPLPHRALAAAARHQAYPSACPLPPGSSVVREFRFVAVLTASQLVTSWIQVGVGVKVCCLVGWQVLSANLCAAHTCWPAHLHWCDPLPSLCACVRSTGPAGAG